MKAWDVIVLAGTIALVQCFPMVCIAQTSETDLSSAARANALQRREQPFKVWRRGIINEGRNLTNDLKGPMAEQLAHEIIDDYSPLSEAGGYHNDIDADEINGDAHELIAVYPTLPVQNQTALSWALLRAASSIANPKEAQIPPRTCGNMGEIKRLPYTRPKDASKLTSDLLEEVFQSAASNNWTPSKAVKTTVQSMLDQKIVPENLTTKAQAFIELKDNPDAEFVGQEIASIKAELDKVFPAKDAVVIHFDTPEKDANSPPDADLKKFAAQLNCIPRKDRLAYPHTLQISTLPAPSMATLNTSLDKISKSYNRLDQSAQCELAAPLLNEVNKLLSTNLRREAELLQWQIFNAIPDNCLDSSNAICAGLSTWYFTATNRIASAERIIRKEIALQDFNHHSFVGNSNTHHVLANYFEEQGNLDEALKQYREVIRINNWAATAPFFGKNNRADNPAEVVAATKRIQIITAALAQSKKISSR